MREALRIGSVKDKNKLIISRLKVLDLYFMRKMLVPKKEEKSQKPLLSLMPSKRVNFLLSCVWDCDYFSLGAEHCKGYETVTLFDPIQFSYFDLSQPCCYPSTLLHNFGMLQI